MQIETYLSELISQCLIHLNLEIIEPIELEYPSEAKFGDFSSNVAMVLFSQNKANKNFGYKSPGDLAIKLTEFLEQNRDRKIIAKIEVAGPGFINFTLAKKWLLTQALDIANKGIEIEDKQLLKQKIIVEFTDPNPFKEFHIGHLYSNTVGESICRLLESQGAEVKRADYFGDVGMHVAKSVWGMQQKLAKISLEELKEKSLPERVKFLGQAYALGASAYKDDEKVQKQIKEINFLVFVAGQDRLVEQEEFQPQVDYKKYLQNLALDYEQIKELYYLGRSWSLSYFDEIYKRVGMKFDFYFPESLVGEYGLKLVKDGLKEGIFVRSQGAVVFPGSKYGLHDRVFINSLGLPTYEAKELGLAPEKYRRYQYDKSIIITGNEINEYFKVLLKALTKLKPKLAKKTTHLGHGMVRLPEGKMSSRTGKIITGEWLLDEAKNRVLAMIASNDRQISKKTRNEIAEQVGQAAIKYAFLKSNIGEDISFSFEDSLSFNGNSGPYLQYTLVRAKSILKKANLVKQNCYITKPFDTLLNLKAYSEKELNLVEVELLRYIFKYYSILKQSTIEFAPHYLCNYLYQLAQQYNKLYNNQRILDSKLGLALTITVARMLEHGLQILGIKPVEKM